MTQLLAPHEQRFLVAVIEGKSYAEAYKAAKFPDPARLGKISESGARSGAQRMLKNTALRDALGRAQARVVEAAQITTTDLVRQLLETRDIALSCDPPQCSASAACTLGIGKLLGLVIDRSEIVHSKAKPSPVPSTVVELSEDEWRKTFTPITHNDR